MDHGIEHGHIGVGLELQRAPGVFANVGDARVSQHNLGPFFGCVLHEGGRHRVVGRGVGADHKDQVRMLHIVDLVTHCARAHAFEQGRHAGCMAQARAVVYVVGAKAGAHQLLEQIGFFIAALGRAETGQCLLAKCVAQITQTAGGQGQCFFPSRFAEHSGPVGRVPVQVVKCFGVFGHTGLADQWHGQALRAGRIVKAKAAFHTQAAVVGGAIASVHADDHVVLDVVGKQAANTAERADRVHLFVDDLGANLGFWHQRTGGACLHTFATGHAGAVTHGVVQIKHDLAVAAAHGVANHIVHLFFTAGAHAAVALDARIQIHSHRGVRNISLGLFAAQSFEFGAHLHIHTRSPVAQLAMLL